VPSPNAPYWLLPFDRDADYVYGAWPKGFTVNGYHPRVGDLVDKSQFSTRMLKEHYERRWIRRAEEADWNYITQNDRPFAPPLAVEAAPQEAAQTVCMAADVPVRRKGGRPKGSKNKPKS